MPKHPNITITLPADASNGDIILACLRALASNDLGHELEAFAHDTEKGGSAHLRQTAKQWFNLI